MTPERWQQIDRLLELALEQGPGERAGFLDKACADDEELRGEVEALLAAHEQAESFLSIPALATAGEIGASPGSLPVGSDIGHYQILSRLGEGGMGVVYKARDKELGRSVAIKLLSPGLVGDPEHRKRLVLEARAASALNHPNIITVHEIGIDKGMHFIVMEYVAGKSLDQLIPRKGLPLSETLEFAIQTAEALAQPMRLALRIGT
jgi:serine/threonine protein kinase